MNRKKNASFMRRLGCALHGIREALKRESSLRLQFLAVIILIMFCIFARPSLVWCALFSLISAVVISLEMVNSAVETALDKLHPSRHPEIGFAKDCLAGAVTVSSIAALLIFILFISERYFV
jgi:undecaprenol kinase